MNIAKRQRGIYRAFALSLSVTFLLAPLFAVIPIHPAVPALLRAMPRLPKIRCLQLALLAGLSIDLLSGQRLLGLHAITYCITTLFFYRVRHRLFEDIAWTLPLMTWLFMIALNLANSLLLQIPLTPCWLTTTVLLSPGLNALFAYAIYHVAPVTVRSLRMKKGLSRS